MIHPKDRYSGVGGKELVRYFDVFRVWDLRLCESPIEWAHDQGMNLNGMSIAHEGFGRMDALGHMSGWGWGLGVFGLVMMLALIGLAVWLIVSVSRRGAPRAGSGQSALETLDDRYARGEIDRDEYLERRADLREQR